MKNTFFIAGTDTDVGKTLVAEALLFCAREKNLDTIAMKPIAAGADKELGGEKYNQDAISLQTAATRLLPYPQVNPLLLQSPIAPHIAAHQENKQLTSSKVEGFIRGFLMNKADFKLIEGAGGWFVPLNNRETLSDAIKKLDIPVVLVIGLKLGCLNHALLTVNAIRQSGVKLAGWVGSQVDPNMAVLNENIETLNKMIPAQCLGIIPYQAGIDGKKAAEFLFIEKLTI